MERYYGNKIFGRIVIGTVRLKSEDRYRVAPVTVEDPDRETERYEEAVRKASAELRALSAEARQNLGEWDARIFEVHAMMTEDVDYREEVIRAVRSRKLCAEYAVFLAGRHFSKMFADMEDEYFRARAQDVKDITNRLIRILKEDTAGSGTGALKAQETADDAPHILAVTELTPGDLVQQSGRILGVVCESGTAYSHAAILAKSMGIPMLTGIRISAEMNGRRAILDANRGVLIVDPDAATVTEYLHILSEDAKNEAALAADASAPAVTESGKRIPLLANIGDLSELAAAKKYGAEGIGLLRTEFLFLNTDRVPSEQKQFEFYREVIKAMGGRPVVIRTIDIGADKPAPCLPMPKEDNPALGQRAVRISLANPELFRDQLRAVLRAGSEGNVSVLFPMITSEWEMKEIQEHVEAVRGELLSEGIDASNVKLGVMIETPASAVLSDRLSEYADFFSIGTNDLAQYVLAADRKNAAVSRYYNPAHEAVMRLIAMTVGNAHRKGIPVSVCGELAADTAVTEQLIALGVDELSVSPSLLPEVRKAVRKCTL